jgi:hypothetical protein
MPQTPIDKHQRVCILVLRVATGIVNIIITLYYIAVCLGFVKNHVYVVR